MFFLLQYILLPPCSEPCQECHCNLSVSGFQEIHFSCFIESFCFQRYYVLRASEALVKLSLGFSLACARHLPLQFTESSVNSLSICVSVRNDNSKNSFHLEKVQHA